MTATCREACCSATPRLAVSELFERGYRRNRAAPLPIEGAQCTDADGNSARFSLHFAERKIASVGFRATTCATLIAYCEYIAEVVPGFSPEIAKELTATQVVESVPGVPAFKHARAVLAVAAFRATLAAAAPPFVIPGRAIGASPEPISPATQS
jgi:NifU-like N terminal domain